MSFVIRHHMKLQPKPFEQIVSGTKTIELRLNDPRRQGMRVGEQVLFTKEPENEKSVLTVITERLEYPTFALLAADFPPEILGYDRPVSAENARPFYYSEEDERRYGALGLRIEIHGG
ncbi:MAG: ASCH domain-containing protein [Alphaproteobacteria bacterium]|nr:MAG: ASCH domain-containing protein [Alphaproteobacteria bacterium]